MRDPKSDPTPHPSGRGTQNSAKPASLRRPQWAPRDQEPTRGGKLLDWARGPPLPVIRARGIPSRAVHRVRVGSRGAALVRWREQTPHGAIPFSIAQSAQLERRTVAFRLLLDRRATPGGLKRAYVRMLPKERSLHSEASETSDGQMAVRALSSGLNR